jgi:16S rRNA (guanine527-N7)-methyltransferase
MNGDPIEQLLHGSDALGIHLGEGQIRQFRTYLDLLVSANSTMNLTGVRDGAAIVRRHFLESLALGSALRQRGLLADDECALDLGSGAGLPGVPMKIAWPGITLALLESTGKKARFLEGLVEALGLQSTSVLAGRSEEFAHRPDLREAFGLVVARTVAAMPGLVELALPFLHSGGVLAALKGSRVDEELFASTEALKVCGGRLMAQSRIEGSALSLVLIEKTSVTPEAFPRRPGLPARRPIGS